jgi:hypothetical protein
MKKTLALLLLFSVTILKAQNSPSLLIDNVSTQFSNVSLPYWLKAGQTINIGNNAKSVSILEFNVNGTALEFSQAINLISTQTVPSDKVWKIEAIGLIEQNTSLPNNNGSSNISTSSSSNNNTPTIFQSPRKFESPGVYSWQVPPGVTRIYLEVWGAGGSGGGTNYTNPPSGGGGGGAGGYSYGYFDVIPGNTYAVTVGAGGFVDSNQAIFDGADGGNSSVGNIIIANGGKGGKGPTSIAGGIGGLGGVGNYSNGGNGSDGGFQCACAGPGGNSISGSNPAIGSGGNGKNISTGTFSQPQQYQNGIRGQVYIYW